MFNEQVMQKILLWNQNNDTAAFTEKMKLDKAYLPIISDYIRHLFLKITLNDFIQERYVEEVILGYEDTLLKKLNTDPTYMGGNPAYPTMINF